MSNSGSNGAIVGLAFGVAWLGAAKFLSSKGAGISPTSTVDVVLTEEEEDQLRPLRKESIPAARGPSLRLLCSAHGCSTISNLSANLDVGASSSCGPRASQEDFWSVAESVLPRHGSLLCVMDGHGGTQVAEFCAANAWAAVAEQPKQEEGRGNVMRRAFPALHQRIGTDVGRSSGAVGVLVWIEGREATVGNVGDVRAVVVTRGQRKVLVATREHKCSVEEEEQLIRQKGGVVVRGRLSGILAVSRSLGDLRADKYLTRDPHVEDVKLDDPENQVLIIASDGLFDVVKDEELSDIVFAGDKKKTTQQMADELVQLALQRNTQDNVTVMVWRPNA